MIRWYSILFTLLLTQFSNCKTKPGIFYFPSKEDTSGNPSGSSQPRTFFKKSALEGHFECKEDAKKINATYTISIWSFKTRCYKIYNDEENKEMVRGYVNYLLAPSNENKKNVETWEENWNTAWIRCYQYTVTCDTFTPLINTSFPAIKLCPGYRELLRFVSNSSSSHDNNETISDKESESGKQSEIENSRNRRDGASSWEQVRQKTQDRLKSLTVGDDPLKSQKYYSLINITRTGSFYIGWLVQGDQNSPVNRDFMELRIKARDVNGYLEAKDYPLLIFYLILSVVYGVLGLIWLVICGIHWRDILQIQVWIGGMLALNMIEMSVFCNKYQTVNNGNEVSDGMVIFAELLSTFKHGLSRVLVLIICMGYGIVKPRLGSTKHLIFALGLAYCLFVSLDSIYVKLVAPQKPMSSRQRLYAFIPRAVINAMLIWWIIASLVATIRCLRLRRNVIKLTLYRHFSNALAFAIVSCIGFEIWWVHLTKDGCIQNWKEYWLSDSIFWNLIFTLILIIIMFLWRPTINNSRYAFSPLLDTDEEDEEETINNAFEGMKLRNIKKNGSSKQNGNIDDDLKWVEENIPSTLGDTVFEKFVDSEEEQEQIQYERSKMQ